MVFGALGLLAGQTVGLVRGGLNARQLMVRALLSGFLLLVLFGLNPDSDVLAHAGGFAAGIIIGAVLTLSAHRLPENALANRIAELICAGLVTLPWCLALAR